MDTTQPWPGNVDGEFDALDFGDEFGDDNAEQSAIDAFDADEPAEPADTATEPRAIDILPEDIGEAGDTEGADNESPLKLTTVTNPPDTVSVTASMDGTIHDVELSADAARMTESELADEILVIADLARQQASSKLLTVLLEGAAEAVKELTEVEVDDKLKGLVGDIGETLADRLENGLLRLSSPEQAAQAQAEVFATRYTSDDASSPSR